jgi:diguanylate cyclase (GGDEF)-like protein
MLSLRRNINRLDKEEQLVQSALGAYAGAISLIRNFPLTVDRASAATYKDSLREMEAQIAEAREAEVLDRSRDALLNLVREYQAKAEVAGAKKEEDLRAVIEALSEATQVLSLHHSGQADRLREFTSNLQESEKLSDLGQMRRRIASHVRDLRSLAEQSKRENETSVTEVQSQLSEFRARLDTAERRATLDGLTGLLNRGEGEARLNGMIEAGNELSAILVDLNSFKTINDTWGHAAGDQVLKTSARILANFVRSGDLVCRWGGDEFLAVLRSSEEIAKQRVTSLDPLLRGRQKIVILGKLFEISTSAAIGVASHRSGESAHDFIARVDSEMYRVKKGKERVAVSV